MSRNSGKTFRAVMLGLHHASHGKQYFLASRTIPHLNVACRIAHTAVRCLTDINSMSRKITFPNGGFLKFVTWDELDRPETMKGFEDPHGAYDYQ